MADDFSVGDSIYLNCEILLSFGWLWACLEKVNLDKSGAHLWKGSFMLSVFDDWWFVVILNQSVSWAETILVCLSACGFDCELGVIAESEVQEDATGVRRWEMLSDIAPISFFGMLGERHSPIIPCTIPGWNIIFERMTTESVNTIILRGLLSKVILYGMTSTTICSTIIKTIE